MATPKKDAKPRKTYTVPENVLFQQDNTFQPISSRMAHNPFAESIRNAVLGAIYVIPDNLDDEQKQGVKNRLRGAASALKVSLSFVTDSNGREGWRINGPIKERKPRTPKDKAA